MLFVPLALRLLQAFLCGGLEAIAICYSCRWHLDYYKHFYAVA
jgi:hypothetical protein